ncbi:MAG TPA: M23 family metallopeptidase [Rugosimonospora sp.]|nr:M23 family metallopeptidase [Rugosimonospora sp.]
MTAAYVLDGLSGDPDTTNAALGCGGGTVDVNAKLPSMSQLSAEQVHNAAIIVQVGQQYPTPPRAWVIAIATALQESNLHNYGDLGSHNDHDSLGLFQQRPSQGWGTPEQIMDPVYSSRKFYQKLLTVPNWQNLPLTRAAQAVQRSAYPDAYAKHEALATLVVNTLTNGAAQSAIGGQDGQCATDGQIAASGWTNPVPGSILGSGFRTADRPTHQGDDLIAARYSPIYAAAAGIVTLVRCQAHLADGTEWGCGRDGGVNVLGCGWYVEITHADNVITRYCHMVEQPMVHVGQQVAAGQQIGRVGSTGHSSGPHCHFEVHLNGDRSDAGAVDPAPFMAAKGAPLGKSA